MKKGRLTNTTLFLVPVLGLDVDGLVVNHGFINGYMEDKEQDTSSPCPVFLLFRPDDLIEFQKFVDQEYKRTDNLVLDYDYDGGFVVLLYEFSEKFHKDYRRFIKGKYSKFSLAFTARLPAYEKNPDGSISSEISLQRNIVLKIPDFVALLEEDFETEIPGECWSIPDKTTETLDIEKVSRKLKINQWRQISQNK